MTKNEDKSFWSKVGVLIALLGVTAKNGGAVCILTIESLFILFLELMKSQWYQRLSGVQ